MFDHPQHKSYYQFLENFHTNLHAKSQLHPSRFLYIANLLFYVL